MAPWGMQAERPAVRLNRPLFSVTNTRGRASNTSAFILLLLLLLLLLEWPVLCCGWYHHYDDGVHATNRSRPSSVTMSKTRESMGIGKSPPHHIIFDRDDDDDDDNDDDDDDDDVPVVLVVSQRVGIERKKEN
jgi:hypothetical protein